MARFLRGASFAAASVLLLGSLAAAPGAAQEPASSRSVLIEAYHRGADEEGARAIAASADEIRARAPMV